MVDKAWPIDNRINALVGPLFLGTLSPIVSLREHKDAGGPYYLLSFVSFLFEQKRCRGEKQANYAQLSPKNIFAFYCAKSKHGFKY